MRGHTRLESLYGQIGWCWKTSLIVMSVCNKQEKREEKGGRHGTTTTPRGPHLLRSAALRAKECSARRGAPYPSSYVAARPPLSPSSKGDEETGEKERARREPKKNRQGLPAK